ncbi:MAG: TylF/MycF/NovP-related O-methyltransferase [Prosthecobacter sp.]|uniref:TylF/MycF/NovP-related O-methyltransferase n=1 Tax=Prosthecobacter sp. TaxID=1965333 RepID=UPI003BAF51E5
MKWFADLCQCLKNVACRTKQEAQLLQHTQLQNRITELELYIYHTTAAQSFDYDADSLRVWNKNVDFMSDPRFRQAYFRGMDSGHQIGRAPGSHDDIHIEWRVHMLLWAASHAAHLEGDFVECGVNTGIFSLAICDYLDFNKTGKSFFLFDTFEGIPVEQMSEKEKAGKAEFNKTCFPECFEQAKANFQPYPSAILVRGKVPDTLTQVDIPKVAFLSIDLNIATPERLALCFFWDKLVSGAVIVLDDYGWKGYEEQKTALDDFARGKGVMIATLPTGQGLLLKP